MKMAQQEDNGPLPAEDQAPKMTDWENEPTLLMMRSDFENAKRAHDTHQQKVDNWNDLLNVTGKAKPKKIEGRSSVQPRLVRRQAEWRYSALTEPFLGTNKLFQVSPVTFEDKPAALQNELLLNWQFRTKMNKVKFVDDMVRSTVDDGTCVIQLGWCREVKTEKQTVPVYDYFAMDPLDAMSIDMLQQAINMQAEDPNTYETLTPDEVKAAVDYFNETGEPTTVVLNRYEEQDVEVVVANHPTATILELGNFYPDPSCGSELTKAMFCCVSFETNKADLEKYPGRYKNLEQVNWDGNTSATDPDHVTHTPTDYMFTDKLRKKVVAYEYWGFYNIHGGTELFPFVATWIGSTLIRMEENPFPDRKLPFVLIPYLPVKRQLMGEPDAVLLEENQNILGAVTRGMIDLLGKSANSQQGIAKGMLDPLNRRRYDRGDDYEFNPSVADPRMGFHDHKYPELPTSALTLMGLQNQDAESLTGVKAFSGGLSGDAYGDVAANTRGVLDASSKREMAILRRLAQGMTEVGNKIIAMNSVFLSEEEVVRVTNEDFVAVRKEDLIGNFDLETDISTAEVDNQKSQDLGFMLQTIGPNMDPALSNMILAEIARLKKMPDLAHKLATYQPQPDPMAEMVKKLEIEKLQAEVNEINAKAEKARADARKAIADADKSDLDFVEQETGTKHARELEKQAGQARGNQDLEITKALTKPTKEGEKQGNLEAAIGFNVITQNKDNAGQAV